MARAVKPSLFDRKLQDLEQQRELIQNDIRSLSKSLRKIEEGGDLPPLRSRSLETRAPVRTMSAPPSPVPAPEPPRAEVREAPVPPVADRVFDKLAPIEAEDEAGTTSTANERSLEPLVVDTTRRLPPLQTPKFANYLASGSFGNRRPLAQERRIQRNKAIFMVVVLVIVLVIVLRFVL